ncbi:DNA-binding transcriptional LysR family regulator [Thermosporothrix hazakensis]|jgi:DNA-binding transcriptional LysR family regulator|uniref:DNA-binding transcriptional LysR family regulator n=1 Tax=Thermosporothrix hazakensis TaxID=644383 RepID=A0A326UCP1_THEHA|nr:LysR family transcriptional regulator [Thermosporothrix hazakensis]PZW36218.1 DNA-binding transcriptional LysR family regulator [Thermosporothrix hazakensis]GCE46868.1 LysR family transcriptional regulator [Thermosporothrix hazakensis]
MDLEQLFTFERVVREGSFSKAARSLNISQPTISARIQALENELGGTLFTRGGRVVTLTERGESFLPYARRAMSVLREGIEAAQFAGQSGSVMLAAMQSLSGSFLASTIERFYATHQRVHCFLHVAHSAEIIAMLTDGLVKLGLISYPFLAPHIKQLLRFSEPLYLMVGEAHPLARRPEVTLEDVRHLSNPLLSVRWGPSVDSYAEQLGLLPQPGLDLPFNTIRHLLLRGMGAAFLTRMTVAEDLDSGRIVQVEVKDLPPLYRESALVCLRGSTLSPAVRDFVQVMKDVAASMPGITRLVIEEKR